MTDCADLGNCLLPMWIQYLIVVFAFALLGFRVWLAGRSDPYDRM